MIRSTPLIVMIVCMLTTCWVLDAAGQNVPRNSRAKIIVKVPEDAKVYIEDLPTKQSGTTRTYNTPDLKAGEELFFHLKVEVVRQGKLITKTKKIAVLAYHISVVDFSTIAGDTESVESEKGKNGKITLDIGYTVGGGGMKNGIYEVDVFDPDKPSRFSVYYTGAANYEVAKAKGRPVESAKWKQIISKSVSLPYGIY
jgi:uncharacterized protein (TIGR03000 family)